MSWKKGDVVMDCLPYAHVLSGAHRGQRCDQCFKLCETESDLKKCSQCKVCWYCSRKCQRAAWNLHKAECQALKQSTPHVPTESVRLVLKLVIRYQNGDNDKTLDEPGIRTFDDLKSHITEIQDSKRVEDFNQLFITLVTFTKDTVDLPDLGVIFEIFCQVCINSFTITDGELHSLGVGIYTSASIFDHSCVPNAVAIFDGIRLKIRATEDIPIEDLDKVYISYTELMVPRDERQKVFLEQYYFTCCCARCSDENNQIDAMMKSTICGLDKCPGPVIEISSASRLQCTKCQRTEFDDSYQIKRKRALEGVKARIDKIDEECKKNDHIKALEDCIDFINTNTMLHVISNNYTRILDKAYDASIGSKDYDAALNYAVTTLPAYRLYYSSVHPNLGLQYFRIGKLHLLKESLDQAEYYLKEADMILRITHGEDHPLRKELLGLILQCEMERSAHEEGMMVKKTGSLAIDS